MYKFQSLKKGLLTSLQRKNVWLAYATTHKLHQIMKAEWTKTKLHLPRSGKKCIFWRERVMCASVRVCVERNWKDQINR